MPNQAMRAIVVSLLIISMTIALVLMAENPSRASSTLTPTATAMPVWKALLLVYHDTDVTYIDSDGTTRHLVTRLADEEVLKALWAFRQYTSIAHDFSVGEALIQYDVIHVARAVTSVTSLGEAGYWVSPSDVHIELDEYAPPGSYDSILVHWAQCDQSFDQCVPSAGWGYGLQPTDWANGATYATVSNAPDWMWEVPTVGEPWLHEWLHGVCSYYADLGYTMPTGCADGGSSHGYIWSPTTGWAAYYRDLMTGQVVEHGDHTGITAEAWQTGSILRQSARVFADYFYADTLDSYDRTGVMVWDSTGQNVRTESASPGDSRLYAPVTFARSFAVVGRVHVSDTSVGPYDSIAVALRNDQIEYWGTLAYGTSLAERNHISIMRNDSWGELYPLTLTPGWYTVGIQVDQSAMLIRMKAWADGTNEPDWQTTRTLDPGWIATGIGFRHSGDATTWMDDLFVRESPYRLYLPVVFANH